MEFLKNNGFSIEEINEILNKYDEDTIDTFLFNQDNVEEVIAYFKDFGILNIPKLMLERIDIFYLPTIKLKELFSHYEKESIIQSLDYDASIFDEMM